MNDKEEDVLDPALLELSSSISFNNQVDSILTHIRLTRNEVNRLSDLFEQLENILQNIWPGCLVHPFGSITTGLGITTSDVDCFVDIPEHLKPDEATCVISAKRMLGRYPEYFNQLFGITKAKVPILKFYHLPTNKNVDLSFTSPAAVHNSQLIAYLLTIDKRLLPLSILIKYWSKVHKLTGTNLVPNYSLLLLIIFYLQKINVLPPIYHLQENYRVSFVENWNTSFRKVSYETNNNQNLYELLGGFFKYYSTFNFSENIISPYIGSEINKSVSLCNLNNFELYNHNITNRICPHFNINSIMCVQDVFVHSRNCTVAVHKKLAENFLTFIRFAAEKYETCDERDFLKEILTLKPAGINNLVRNKPHKKRFNQNRVQKHKNIGKINGPGHNSRYNQRTRFQGPNDKRNRIYVGKRNGGGHYNYLNSPWYAPFMNFVWTMCNDGEFTNYAVDYQKVIMLPRIDQIKSVIFAHALLLSTKVSFTSKVLIQMCLFLYCGIKLSPDGKDD